MEGSTAAGAPFDRQRVGTATRHGISPGPSGGSRAKINQVRPARGRLSCDRVRARARVPCCSPRGSPLRASHTAESCARLATGSWLRRVAVQRQLQRGAHLRVRRTRPARREGLGVLRAQGDGDARARRGGAGDRPGEAPLRDHLRDGPAAAQQLRLRAARDDVRHDVDRHVYARARGVGGLLGRLEGLQGRARARRAPTRQPTRSRRDGTTVLPACPRAQPPSAAARRLPRQAR